MHPNLGSLDFRTNGSRSQQLAKRLPEAGPAVVGTGFQPKPRKTSADKNHLPLLRKSAASAFIVSPWKFFSAPPVPAEVH